ncbi:hypothetical protein, conserved [Leishmania tarentolae]|uniref:CBF1-interacting co-repressor CIR N-terminal domain-containing protein n=1 Tax=Leishmania tarentolae TaxID=5689 RepID=A0A640KEX6_LEITA|nr:hypothetical protein, conserved [Leishmania tarentolae]
MCLVSCLPYFFPVHICARLQPPSEPLTDSIKFASRSPSTGTRTPPVYQNDHHHHPTSTFLPPPSSRSWSKMYRAHSKDINRNKSFHPLTYRNLRRVEQLKEEADLNKQKAEDRLKELQRDQEERRYDELVLSNSVDSLSGELARHRQTRSIFAAEYEADAKAVKDASVASPQPPQLSKQEVQLKTSTGALFPVNSFLSKFKKEEPYRSACLSIKEEASDSTTTSSTAVASAEGETSMRKRPRDDAGSNSLSSTRDGSDKDDGATKRTGESAPATGFVTSSEAAQLRKELNLAQKQRHDPLVRVKEYQNKCVAAAARQLHREQETRAVATHDDDKDKLQSRIRELLALKKK